MSVLAHCTVVYVGYWKVTHILSIQSVCFPLPVLDDHLGSGDGACPPLVPHVLELLRQLAFVVEASFQLVQSLGVGQGVPGVRVARGVHDVAEPTHKRVEKQVADLVRLVGLAGTVQQPGQNKRD